MSGACRSFELLLLGRFLQELQETEHFWHWPQEKVAKIVQCGEALEEKNRTTSVSTEY